MKKIARVVVVVLLGCQWLSSQVKIGTNPQNIDPASVLELESTNRVLVITRISTAQMNAINPYAGALVYNNDEDCIFYYNGLEWLNLCENLGLSFTTEPLVNEFSTIVLTENGDNTHIEVSEIRSENIVDFSISGIDIQNNSINGEKLAPNSVGSEELQDNTITDAEIDYNLVTLNDFINDAGYLVAADLISGDAGNDLSPGTDNGVYFNAEALENAIQANADAIAADGDTDATNEFQNLTLTGNQLAISDGNTVDLSGFNNTGSDDQNLAFAGTTLTIEDGNSVDLAALLDNTDNQNLTSATLDGSNQLTIAIEDGNPVTVDLSSLGASGGTDDQIIDSFTFNNTTNDLSISIEDGNTQTVNLSALAGGGGSTELADQITIIGTGAAGDEFEVNDGSINSTKITNGTIQAVDLANNAVETAKILNGNVTPPKLAPGGANQFLQTNAAGTSVSWVDLPAGGTDDQEAFEVPFTPTGNTASTDVQAAIEELQTEIDGISAGGAANPTDELIDLFQLNGTSLEIGEGANLPTPIDFDLVFATDAELAALPIDDADADPINEIQDLASVLTEGADANATVITNAADPVDPQDVATKAYVDANTGGVIVSADVPNSIIAGTDGGALYDDPDADPNNEIQDLLSVLSQGADANATVITNAADPVNPQDVATKAYVDANTGGVIVSADVPNSIIAGTDGGALYDDPDGDPINEIQDLSSVLGQGADANATVITNAADPVNPQDLATKAYVDASGGGVIVSADIPNSITAGTDGGALYDDPDGDPNNEIQDLSSVLGQGTDANASVITNAADPVNPQDLATKAYVDANAGGVIVSADIPNSITAGTDGGALYDDPDADPNNEIELPPGGTSGQVLSTDGLGTYSWVNNAGGGIIVSADSPNSITAGTDGGALYDDPDADPNNEIELPAGGNAGQILSTNGAGIYTWVDDANDGEHTGTTGSVFFANNTTGAPTEDNDSFFWDVSKRFGSGALGVGIDGGTFSDVAKVHIAESIAGQLVYPLHLENKVGDGAVGSAVGLLLGVENVGGYGKAALAFEKTTTFGRGDVHILNNNALTTVSPTLADAVLTVKADGNTGIGTTAPIEKLHVAGNLKLDGDIVARNGIGAVGQVLTTTPTGTEWAAASGGAVFTDLMTIVGDGTAGNVLLVPNGGITTDELLDGTITSVDIEDGQVMTADIADDNVTIEKINAGNSGEVLTTNGTGDVIWAPAAAGSVAVDGVTIDGDGVGTPLFVLNGGITSPKIADGQVFGVDIADGAISGGTAGKIQDNSITSADLQNGSILAVDMGPNSVTGGAGGIIVANSISQGDIGDNAIGAGEIQSDAVSSDEILDASIQPVDIQPGLQDQILRTNAGAVEWYTPMTNPLKSGSGINSIKSIRRISTAVGSLTSSDHTVILEGSVSDINLPTPTLSNQGLILVIKDLGGASTITNQGYRNLGNTLVTRIPNNGVLWIQSDGKEWHQIK